MPQEERLQVSFDYPGGGVSLKRGRANIDLTREDLAFLSCLDAIMGAPVNEVPTTNGVTDDQSDAAGNV